MNILTAPFDENTPAAGQAAALIRYMRQRYGHNYFFMGADVLPPNIDLVHLRLSNAHYSLPAARYAARHHLPVVVSTDGYFVKKKQWWYRFFNRQAAGWLDYCKKNASALVFSADAECTNSLVVPGVRPWVIHPGLPCEGVNDHRLPDQQTPPRQVRYSGNSPQPCDVLVFDEPTPHYINFEALTALADKTPVILPQYDTLAAFVLQKKCGLVWHKVPEEASETFAQMTALQRAEMGLNGYLAVRKLFNIKNTGHLYNELYEYVLKRYGQ